MSNFARSNALPYAPGPRKQVSSPLPDQTQQRRIYDRGHAHSRSWNPEGLPSPPPNPVGRNYRFFQETKQPRVEEFAVPIINEPPPIPVDDGRRRSVVRQAKSFDDRNSNERRQVMNINGRSYTLSEKRRRGPENVSAACQTLWAAKGHLEQLQALGISEPSSVSTSFESNTDSQATADTVDLKPPHTAAKGKRLQYGSLLLQRQFLSTAAVSSMDSNNSTDESSDPAVFASSFESTRSELEQRRLSLMNRNHDQNDSDEAAPGPSSRSIPMQQETQRDYCVDARSDSLFREWSRVDPAYEPVDVRVRLQRGHTVDHSPSHVQVQNARRFSRQFSLASPGPSPLLMPTMERQSMYSDV